MLYFTYMYSSWALLTFELKVTLLFQWQRAMLVSVLFLKLTIGDWSSKNLKLCYLGTKTLSLIQIISYIKLIKLPFCFLVFTYFYYTSGILQSCALVSCVKLTLLLFQSYHFVSVNCSVALATKENLQSQRGVLHGVTSRLSVVTSILFWFSSLSNFSDYFKWKKSWVVFPFSLCTQPILACSMHLVSEPLYQQEYCWTVWTLAVTLFQKTSSMNSFFYELKRLSICTTTGSRRISSNRKYVCVWWVNHQESFMMRLWFSFMAKVNSVGVW